MALPETIRVKLSSEAAGSIALTPVVVQDLATRELIEHMLAIAGKDAARIREFLLRGTLVSGASRFRWTGWEAAPEDVASMLATFPDPDPRRAFDAAKCVRATVRGARQTVDIPRAAGERKGIFQRATFWDALMQIAAAPGTQYGTYSYRDRADRYTRSLTSDDLGALDRANALMRYTTLRDQLRAMTAVSLELWVVR